MDSSPVLYPRSLNKNQTDHVRMNKELKKLSLDPKPSKHLSVLHSKCNIENQDPLNSVNKHKPGTSRLPVLAKSLHLHAPSQFTHQKWEENPLVGKVKRKKSSTKLAPFHLTQPKNSRTVTHNPRPQRFCTARAGAQNSRTVTTFSTSHLQTNATSKPLSGSTGPNGTKLSLDLAPPHSTAQHLNTEKALLYALSQCNGEPSLDGQKSNRHQLSSSISSQSKVSECIVKSSSEIPRTSQNAQPVDTAPVAQFSNGSGVAFCTDRAALHSILQNEGVSTRCLGWTTPKPAGFSSNLAIKYHPQRVSVMKSRQKAGLTPAKSVQFSPDPAALSSILRNEGIKVPRQEDATLPNSMRPTGRPTSVYSAQRVPVTKSRLEATGGLLVMTRDQSPAMKWTPQRVPDTRHRPLSSMRHHSALRTPHTGNSRLWGLKGISKDPETQNEKVVQKLFEDSEEDQAVIGTNSEPKTPADPQPQYASPTTLKVEANRNDQDEKKVPISKDQPFFQAPNRESVIFFSTGKKLFRPAPAQEQEYPSVQLDQRGPSLASVNNQDRPFESNQIQTSQINPSVRNHPKDAHKTSSLSSAAALLRRRLPPLEDLRLDEEVATYTSTLVPAFPAFHPTRPGCGNPLASVLLFKDSSTFVPIIYDGEVTSPCISLRER